MSNNSIWPIDRTQSGATTPGPHGPGSDCNEKVKVMDIIDKYEMLIIILHSFLNIAEN